MSYICRQRKRKNQQDPTFGMSEEEKAALREKESQARHDQHVKEHTLAAERHQVDSQRRALGLNSADAAQEVYECEWGCGFESSVVMEVAEHEKHCSLRPQEAVVTLQSGGQGWLQPSERQKEIEVLFFSFPTPLPRPATQLNPPRAHGRLRTRSTRRPARRRRTVW